ncbi:AzlC family ABC transporter permease [Aliarcobacter skirrowii]|jgi:4-azaleucine resistance transporter AzlC|uniref:AzlC family ABC transporter permease n=1 Tax=Aliarcobacter skirrowii TaxID=28200 RepID=A0AAW9D9K7_9BACT|nr:AzlC family ABC transporter permease [Aliarcobacter skirrowii]MDX4027512.1 AzlC family ABC transporter permease [Aliarcobacter skirrowii]MDX4068822.1 AzlC family ABC transporter permease [Aliarcobacter skirrowii]
MSYIDIIKITSPIFFGYIPLGMAFGIFSVSSGISWQFSTLMSALIYAGSAEFLVVAFILSSATLLEVFFTIFLVNFRHFFYGISMLNNYEHIKGFLKKYSIFGLTDETFALLKLIDIDNCSKQKVYPIIIALSQLYWVGGVFLGAYFTQFLDFNSTGLSFMLTSLFVVLSIELYKKTKSKKILLVAVILGVFGLFLPKEYALIITLSLAAFFLILFKNRIKI